MLSEERDDWFALRTLRQTRQSIEYRQVCLAGAKVLEALGTGHVGGALLCRLFDLAIDQGRLPDPRLAGDENDLTLACRGALQPPLHCGELGAPPEQTSDRG